MPPGFQVDLTALRAAADGITRTAGQVRAHPVASMADGAPALGHLGLAEGLGRFCARWQDGVGHLAEDGRLAGVHLLAAADRYEQLDAAARDGLVTGPVTGPVTGDGPDPAPR